MKGGCLCGEVHYEIAGDPIFVAKCYCKDCQEESGSGHLMHLAVPNTALSIESGNLQTFAKTGDSGGQVVRSFCSACGTTLMGRSDLLNEATLVRAGTLDDSDKLQADMAVFCRSQRGWDIPPGGIPTFEIMPPQF